MENQEEKEILSADEQELNEKKQAVPRRLRENLYDRIPVSVKTMDFIITGLIAVLVICLIISFIYRLQ